MLEILRNAAASWVAKIFFGLLIASFALWGINGIFLTNNTQSVAVVGETKVTEAAFQRAFQRTMRRIQVESGQAVDQQAAVAAGLHYQVAGDLVARAIFTEVAAQNGFTVTDAQLQEALRASPAFIDDFGKFDRLRFDQTLRSMGYAEEEFLQAMRTDLLREQIVGAVTSAAIAPKAMAAALFQRRAEQRAARYVVLPAINIDDIATPDEATLKAYYEATPGPFTAPEYRNLSVLHITAAMLAEGITIDEDEIKNHYDRRKHALGAAETRDMVLAVFPDQAAVSTARARVNAGETLLAVAKDMLDKTDDDLILRDVLLNDVIDAPAGVGFAIEIGALSDPVDTGFGPTLVSPIAVTPADRPAYNEVRAKMLLELQEERAADMLFDVVNALEDERAGGADLETAAATAGLSVDHDVIVDAAGRDQTGTPHDVIAADPALLDEVNTLLPGIESLLLETVEGGFIVLRLDDVIPAALKPFEDVKDQVLTTWKQREATALTQTRALTVGNQVRDAGNLDKVAEELGVKIEQALAVNRYVKHESLSQAAVEVLFNAEAPGEIVEAGGDNGTYIIAELTGIQRFSAADAPAQFAAMREDFNAVLANEMLRHYQVAVQDELGVTINQTIVDRAVGIIDEGDLQ